MASKQVIFFSSSAKAKVVNKNYAAFSNFYESRFIEDGIEYKTVEHYFQSQKTQIPEEKYEIINAASPSIAKRLGRVCTLDAVEWAKRRIEVMQQGIYLKFSQNEDLKQKLLSTGSSTLKEFSTRDKFWGGSCKGSKNALGNLLMSLRSSLQT